MAEGRYKHDKPYREVGWQSLANAIVELAAKDLVALFKYYKNKPNREEAIKMRSDYQFFLSEYFEMLTDLDGGAIIAAIRKEVWGD